MLQIHLGRVVKYSTNGGHHNSAGHCYEVIVLGTIASERDPMIFGRGHYSGEMVGSGSLLFWSLDAESSGYVDLASRTHMKHSGKSSTLYGCSISISLLLHLGSKSTLARHTPERAWKTPMPPTLP